jgi:hypothetical protein
MAPSFEVSDLSTNMAVDVVGCHIGGFSLASSLVGLGTIPYVDIVCVRVVLRSTRPVATKYPGFGCLTYNAD